ncbi:MAG TPA: sugar phosphate isomerase/epimerase [Tepidisphaeraceae bacterium]|nr:sugar phosphate isomerase/epimerase [Tepidisphaeraceae bacterium]
MQTVALALQMYTLRDLAGYDMPGTLRSVAEIGYRYVELAGFGNLKSAGEFRKALDAARLKVCSAHVSLDDLESDLSRVMDDQDAVGNKAIVVPWLDERRRRDAAGYEQVADALNRIGAAIKPRGFTLAYHHHDFEFKTFGGRSGFDILFDRADRELVKAELDVYWAKVGGQDPVALIHRMGSRLPLLHLKDLAAGPEARFAEVGAGILDFPGILAAAARVGVQYGIVEEDDTYDTPPLTAVRTSLENLRQLGLKP